MVMICKMSRPPIHSEPFTFNPDFKLNAIQSFVHLLNLPLISTFELNGEEKGIAFDNLIIYVSSGYFILMFIPLICSVLLYFQSRNDAFN